MCRAWTNTHTSLGLSGGPDNLNFKATYHMTNNHLQCSHTLNANPLQSKSVETMLQGERRSLNLWAPPGCTPTCNWPPAIGKRCHWEPPRLWTKCSPPAGRCTLPHPLPSPFALRDASPPPRLRQYPRLTHRPTAQVEYPGAEKGKAELVNKLIQATKDFMIGFVPCNMLSSCSLR